MRDDEKLMFEKMTQLVEGNDVGLSCNAALNLIAALTVNISPSLVEAEAGAKYAGDQLAEMVKLHWKARSPGVGVKEKGWRPLDLDLKK
jgi:hypothetical protein